MILDKEVSVFTVGSNIKYYKNLGYDAGYRKKVNIKIEDLLKNSDIIVNVKCDVCGKEKKISFRKYIKNTKDFKTIYCCCEKCARIKIEKSCIDKYGFKTSLLNKEIIKKSEETKLKKYNNKNYNNPKKSKETCLKKYNVEHHFKIDIFKLKSIKTCLKKYHCEHPMKNQKIFEKNQKSGYKMKKHEQTGLLYSGSYEKHFLDYCFENKIKVQKLKPIKYKFKNKTRAYHPDFYIKEKKLIVEIKSDYTYKKEIAKNIAKRKHCINQGFNFIFIINKNYKKLNQLLK